MRAAVRACVLLLGGDCSSDDLLMSLQVCERGQQHRAPDPLCKSPRCQPRERDAPSGSKGEPVERDGAERPAKHTAGRTADTVGVVGLGDGPLFQTRAAVGWMARQWGVVGGEKAGLARSSLGCGRAHARGSGVATQPLTATAGVAGLRLGTESRQRCSRCREWAGRRQGSCSLEWNQHRAEWRRGLSASQRISGAGSAAAPGWRERERPGALALGRGGGSRAHGGMSWAGPRAP